jgi:hypothetical protein
MVWAARMSHKPVHRGLHSQSGVLRQHLSEDAVGTASNPLLSHPTTLIVCNEVVKQSSNELLQRASLMLPAHQALNFCTVKICHIAVSVPASEWVKSIRLSTS